MPLQLVLTGTHKEGMDVAKGATATVEEQVASPHLASHPRPLQPPRPVRARRSRATWKAPERRGAPGAMASRARG